MKARIFKRLAPHLHAPKPQPVVVAGSAAPDPTEQHFTVQELAKLWRVDEDTVRDWFREAPGVLRIGAGQRKTLRIARSVMERVYRERTEA